MSSYNERILAITTKSPPCGSGIVLEIKNAIGLFIGEFKTVCSEEESTIPVAKCCKSWLNVVTDCIYEYNEPLYSTYFYNLLHCSFWNSAGKEKLTIFIA